MSSRPAIQHTRDAGAATGDMDNSECQRELVRCKAELEHSKAELESLKKSLTASEHRVNDLNNSNGLYQTVMALFRHQTTSLQRRLAASESRVIALKETGKLQDQKELLMTQQIKTLKRELRRDIYRQNDDPLGQGEGVVYNDMSHL
jgi:chromosome segregation ATPase